jgi:hypothetical protein
MPKAKMFLNMKNFQHVRGHHTKALRELNDSFIECTEIVEFLKSIDHSDPKGHSIVVPGAGKESVTVQRTSKQMRRLMKKAIKHREYEKAIVLLVSNAEDYLFSYGKLLLRSYPDRLDTSGKGNKGEVSVSLKDLIEKGPEQVIEDIIDGRLRNASYGTPADYAVFLNKVLQFELRASAMLGFVELKASRDLIVHAQGVINKIYVEKAGKLARGKAGERLPVDEAYFKASIKLLKQLYSSVYKGTLTRYGNDPALRAALKKHGFS